MASYIKRGETVFFQFRDGKSVLNSQCKPRMFKTAEKATLGVNYIETDEVVEYAEVVRCKDCDFVCERGGVFPVCTNWGRNTDNNGWCYMGERRADDGRSKAD